MTSAGQSLNEKKANYLLNSSQSSASSAARPLENRMFVKDQAQVSYSSRSKRYNSNQGRTSLMCDNLDGSLPSIREN